MKLVWPILIILVSVLFQSCIKCSKRDSYEGIVLGNFDSTTCIPFFGQGVINSQRQLDSVIGLSNQPCNTPQLDFTRFTILGYGFGGSCHSSCIADVEVDAAHSCYVYTLKTYDCFCFEKVLEEHRSIVVVPKLPPGDTVQFVLKKLYDAGQ